MISIAGPSREKVRLGAAIAAGLAEAGARIICHGNSRTAEQTANHIVSRGGMADVVQGDLSQHGSASEVFAQSLQRFGAIDILVNNAGAIRRAPAVDYSVADWSYILQVNLTSAFELSQMTGRHIMERCATGKILNIASVLS